MESRIVFSLTLLISLLILFSCPVPTVSSSSKARANEAYVAKACNSITRASFSAQCVYSLAPYTNKIRSDSKRLCKYALSVAVADACAVKTKAHEVLKTEALVVSEKAAMRACRDQTTDSVDDLKKCQTALKKVNGTMSAAVNKGAVTNFKTWASSALTNYETCKDEMNEEQAGPARQPEFRKAIVQAKTSASIFLALITYVTSS